MNVSRRLLCYDQRDYFWSRRRSTRLWFVRQPAFLSRAVIRCSIALPEAEVATTALRGSRLAGDPARPVFGIINPARTWLTASRQEVFRILSQPLISRSAEPTSQRPLALARTSLASGASVSSPGPASPRLQLEWRGNAGHMYDRATYPLITLGSPGGVYTSR